MVGAAAVGDGALLEVAQPRRRLARVEQRRGRARRRHRPHDLRGRRGDAREPAEEVQRRALGAQQRARGARHAQHRRRRLAPLALRAQPLDLRVRVEPEEDGLRDVEPGDHARRLLRDGGDAARGRVDGRLGGHVARADVLRQRGIDEIRNGHADQYSRPARAQRSTKMVRERRVARAVQARPGVLELAQVLDELGGDALAGQQRRDARRVAGDRLGGDAPDGVVDARRPRSRRGRRRAAGRRPRCASRPARGRAPRPRRSARSGARRSAKSCAKRSRSSGGWPRPRISTIVACVASSTWMSKPSRSAAATS